MGLFAKKQQLMDRNKGLNFRDEILGTFDDLFILRKPITLFLKNSFLNLSIYFVDENKNLIQISNEPILDKLVNKKAKCGYGMDNTWYEFTTEFIKAENKFYVRIPELIHRKERRTKLRAVISKRESARITAIENIGKGIGVTGNILNICCGGVYLEIERTMSMSSETDIRPNKEMFKKGDNLAIIKCKGIKGIAEFDTSGSFNRIDYRGKYFMSIEFSELPSGIVHKIEQLSKERGTKFEPIKRSRQKRLEREKQKEESPDTNKTKITMQKQVKKIKAAVFGEGFEKILISSKLIEFMELTIIKKPFEIIKLINQKDHQIFFLSEIYNNRSIFDLLRRLEFMNVLETIEIIMLFKEVITTEQKQICKTMGINTCIFSKAIDFELLKRIILNKQ
jgi:uncharacterized membrane protein (UPF0127 family)